MRDGDAPDVRVFKHYGGTAVTDLWMTTSVPADNSRIENVGTRDYAIEPPPGGAIFVSSTILIMCALPISTGSCLPGDGPHAMVKEGARHPGMHKTSTVDYVVVLSGEITRSWMRARYY
jgi:hypothetical protein